MALPPRFLQPALEWLRALATNGLRYPIPLYDVQNDVRHGIVLPIHLPRTAKSSRASEGHKLHAFDIHAASLILVRFGACQDRVFSNMR